jgi:endonuclease G
MFLRMFFFFPAFLLFGFLFSDKQQPLKNTVKSIHSHEPFDFLPAIAPDDEIVKHTAYTLCYAEKYEQAKWVAYQLTSEMVNNSEGEERTNNFRSDKEVPSGSASPDDYKKSGYDRGHLCPAGDMTWSEQTMSESFFMSNMSPQAPAFNRGIWKKLEGDVREWAKQNEEIYVVTAGVLEDSLSTIGLDKVAVPRYYYKVILDYKLPEYKAIAFVLPNEGSKQSVFDFAVSIDSVEHLTGINFFSALPDSLQDYLESHVDITKWE